MALSDREQQLFEQLEKQLEDEDPRLAATLAAPAAPTLSTRRIVLGVLIDFVGIVTVFVGLMLPGLAPSIFVGVFGFAVMVAGLHVALSTAGPKPPTPQWLLPELRR
ncbi:DUF3040 domain-containing protein [Arthrobacter crusticola]|uniref:DUF3040 domain-containing protein n=1 Tax=Arthrobacter crusticola TaxID=2547960 RepID=A0A4V3AM54_9MICC|nr:DUF3040 domain-containing protein [Arthrobacter crusticola]TDK25649.1 DUF3040 domain-containing protein [Arthrobacter crusticola]